MLFIIVYTLGRSQSLFNMFTGIVAISDLIMFLRLPSQEVIAVYICLYTIPKEKYQGDKLSIQASCVSPSEMNRPGKSSSEGNSRVYLWNQILSKGIASRSSGQTPVQSSCNKLNQQLERLNGP